MTEMFGVVVCAVLLAALVSPSQEHGISIGNATCIQEFQRAVKETLSEILRVKQECGNAPFQDCCKVKEVPSSSGTTAETGTYTISPLCMDTPSFIRVENKARCDMDRGNGGWLVIQRRVAGGTENFNRRWSDYEEGFGDLEGEFWYGLKNIQCLTNRESVELRFDLEDERGNKVTRTYQEFRVEGPENKYRLHIGRGDTPAGAFDFMAYHNHKYFSTKDRDSDTGRGHCAVSNNGGWWWGYCGHTNPNGLHSSSTTRFRPSARTGSTRVYYPNYEMKIRPKSCSLSQTCTCT